MLTSTSTSPTGDRTNLLDISVSFLSITFFVLLWLHLVHKAGEFFVVVVLVFLYFIFAPVM